MVHFTGVALIRSFGAVERRSFRRFLQSPYFNSRQDLIDLFDYIKIQEEPVPEEVWAKIYPDKPYDDTAFRLLLSYLNRLLEKFLLIESLEVKLPESQLQLAGIYRKRSLPGHHQRTINALGRMLEQQPLRNERYYNLLRQYHLEKREAAVRQNPTDTQPLQIFANTTDILYLISRLRMICLELSQRNVYSGGEDSLYRHIIDMANSRDWRDLPAISTYLSAINMLNFPEESDYYSVFMKKVRENAPRFSQEEMREFYNYAINHCIRRANAGRREMETELLALYKQALPGGYLFEQGILSRFTYHNIAGAALRCGELEWAEEFIRDNNSFLEVQYRESALSFNLARLHFTQKKYDSVLQLLQKANYSDPLLHLAAKTLLLKTYYILKEFDLLEAHFDAMRNYLHRKKVLGYHRKNYLNIIRFTEKIIREGHDRKAIALLRAQIIQEEVLTEREWLLEQL